MPQDERPAVADHLAVAPGAVTLYDGGRAARRGDRTVVTLLCIITALLVMLVVGLGVAAYGGYRVYRQAEATITSQQRQLARDLAATSATSREFLRELDTRQRTLGHGLDGRARATLADLDRLAARRSALSAIPADPLGKLDATIRLNQLVADELLVLTRHLADSTGIAGRGLRPLPAQARLPAKLAAPRAGAHRASR